jgi:hypothetical protein
MSENEHLDKARFHLNALVSTSNTSIDWEITIMFYVALHLVRASMSRNQLKNSKNHKNNSDYIDIALPDIEDEYERLYDASIKARYYSGSSIIQNWNDRLKDLDVIISFLEKKYQWVFPSICTVKRVLPQGKTLKHFQSF